MKQIAGISKSATVGGLQKIFKQGEELCPVMKYFGKKVFMTNASERSGLESILLSYNFLQRIRAIKYLKM